MRSRTFNVPKDFRSQFRQEAQKKEVKLETKDKESGSLKSSLTPVEETKQPPTQKYVEVPPDSGITRGISTNLTREERIELQSNLQQTADKKKMDRQR